MRATKKIYMYIKSKTIVKKTLNLIRNRYYYEPEHFSHLATQVSKNCTDQPQHEIKQVAAPPKLPKGRYTIIMKNENNCASYTKASVSFVYLCVLSRITSCNMLVRRALTVNIPAHRGSVKHLCL